MSYKWQKLVCQDWVGTVVWCDRKEGAKTHKHARVLAEILIVSCKGGYHDQGVFVCQQKEQVMQNIMAEVSPVTEMTIPLHP